VYYAIQIAMKIQEYGIMRMKIKEINTLQWNPSLYYHQ
jgi:hypothetical protein